MKIEFYEYKGIEGYIELMKHDVEPLKNPKCERIDLCYNGKDIKAVLDYITNLQQRIDKAIEYIEKNKKTISQEQAKDTKLQVGTFMWNIDELEDILKGSEE